MEIIGQGAGERFDQVVAPILPQPDVKDIDLQHIAGLGALDRDRAGEDVARQHPLGPRMDVRKLRRNVKFGPVGHHVGAAADGVDGDLVAALDREHRLEFCFEEAPVAGLGARREMMVCHGISRASM